MRIISKFHDFYDSLADGSDSNIWAREQSTILIDKNDLFFKQYGYGNPFPVEVAQVSLGKSWRSTEFIQFEMMILIFCGRIIPLWRCQDKISYSIDELRPFLGEQGCNLKELERWSFYSPFRIADKLFAGEVSPEVGNFNMTYKCPIILLRQYKGENRDLKFVMELNPCLKDLEFQRKINIVDTFQEVERYVFNDLVEMDSVTSTGNDKVIAASKGFGHKYAIRKEPRSN
jgi:hypothetical protein